jgi:hypothetical protein
MPFGFGLKEKKEEEKVELQKPEIKFDAKYCGGHKAYPTRKGVKTKILVFNDRIEMSNDRFLLSVRFDQMTNIENLSQNKIYTVIEYKDGLDKQSLMFDLGKHLEKKQTVLYQKMIATRDKGVKE